MTTERQDDGPAHARRAGRRARATLVTMVAVTLLWASLAFLQTGAIAGSAVDTVPGTSPDGRIADVVPLTGEVTAPRGAAKLQEGVQFARLDVATQFHTDMRVTLAWQNAPGFSRTTQTGGWQLRFGIYYPVRTGNCTGITDGLLVTLTGDQRFGTTSTEEVFCVVRDEDATGPGIVTSGEHQGTQMLARNRLVGLLAPQVDLSTYPECSTSTSAACKPAGLDDDKRTYFIVGSLLNPGGHVPVGQQGEVEALEMFIRVARGTA